MVGEMLGTLFSFLDKVCTIHRVQEKKNQKPNLISQLQSDLAEYAKNPELLVSKAVKMDTDTYTKFQFYLLLQSTIKQKGPQGFWEDDSKEEGMTDFSTSQASEKRSF